MFYFIKISQNWNIWGGEGGGFFDTLFSSCFSFLHSLGVKWGWEKEMGRNERKSLQMKKEPTFFLGQIYLKSDSNTQSMVLIQGKGIFKQTTTLQWRDYLDFFKI